MEGRRTITTEQKLSIDVKVLWSSSGTVFRIHYWQFLHEIVLCVTGLATTSPHPLPRTHPQSPGLDVVYSSLCPNLPHSVIWQGVSTLITTGKDKPNKWRETGPKSEIDWMYSIRKLFSHLDYLNAFVFTVEVLKFQRNIDSAKYYLDII